MIKYRTQSALDHVTAKVNFSFFSPKTVIGWNHLDGSVVHADSRPFPNSSAPAGLIFLPLSLFRQVYAEGLLTYHSDLLYIHIDYESAK